MREESVKQRLVRILAEDKGTIGAETEAAARRDFLRVAREYFDTETLDLKVDCERGGYRVDISFRASRVKNFTTLKS